MAFDADSTTPPTIVNFSVGRTRQENDGEAPSRRSTQYSRAEAPGLDAVPHQPVPHRPDAMLAAVGYPPLNTTHGPGRRWAARGIVRIKCRPEHDARAGPAAGRHGALCV